MVRPHGTEPGVFDVLSHSRRKPGAEQKWHTVNLLAYRRNGSCECEHFQCRLEPELQRGEPPSEALRCHHIEEAREQLLQDVLNALAKGTAHQPGKLIARE